MLKPLRNKDQIFHEQPFLDSEVPFNVMYRISEQPDALLLHSGDSRIIIAQSSPEMPMWIWVDPQHTKSLVRRIITDMEDTFRNRESLKIVGTPQFLESFVEEYPCTYQKEMVLEAYECREVRMPQGFARVMPPSVADIPLVAEFCAGFLSEALGIRTSGESQREGAETLVRSGNLYVLKVEEEIVAMSNIAHRGLRHARINNVYTPPALRKHGYASLLVTDLSLRILSEGLVPMLYTDLTNETSNRIYQKIGYTPCGKVDQYRIMKIEGVNAAWKIK